MAKEYIERNSVLKEQRTFTEYDEGGWDAAVCAVPVDAIKNFPTADVVEVVRCRECKHWHEETGWCYHHSHFIKYGKYGEEFCHPWESSEWKMFDADYFCADGERRDGECG